MSPSKLSFAMAYHKLICKEIGKAITELREQGKEVYSPYSITYIISGDEFPLPYINQDNIQSIESTPIDLPLATLDVMEHNARHT